MRVNVELPKAAIEETTSKELIRLRNENDRLRRRVETLNKNSQTVKELKKRLDNNFSWHVPDSFQEAITKESRSEG